MSIVIALKDYGYSLAETPPSKSTVGIRVEILNVIIL